MTNLLFLQIKKPLKTAVKVAINDLFVGEYRAIFRRAQLMAGVGHAG